jgi:hypothetical protein
LVDHISSVYQENSPERIYFLILYNIFNEFLEDINEDVLPNDRTGSQNAVIQLVNYWPDITLDEYINLKERVENRMVIVDVSAGGDDNVLRHESSDLAYRKEQLRRMQEEVIEMEDVKTGQRAEGHRYHRAPAL